MRLAIAPIVTPSPTWAAFWPAKPPVLDAEAPRTVCDSASWKVVVPALKPSVLTLARLLAVTSSIVCWALSPLMAEYIERIMVVVLLAAASASSRRGPAEVRGSWDRDREKPDSGDDRRVDVGEDVLAHVRGVDGRDDRAVADGDDERLVVDEDDRLA